MTATIDDIFIANLHKVSSGPPKPRFDPNIALTPGKVNLTAGTGILTSAEIEKFNNDPDIKAKGANVLMI